MSDDFFPIGAVVAFGGTLSDGDGVWLPCDGKSLQKTAYPDLFEQIGHIYGGSGNQFKTPDYRGQFLRGASRDSDRDPDVSTREGGDLTGNRVGSSQPYATKMPATKSFFAEVSHLPNEGATHSGTEAKAACPSGDNAMDTCTASGDGDTRPANVYVNFYIKAKSG